MDLPRKMELARSAIASITRHDDATAEEIGECGRLLQQFIKDELAAAAARREARRKARLAKLESKS